MSILRILSLLLVAVLFYVGLGLGLNYSVLAAQILWAVAGGLLVLTVVWILMGLRSRHDGPN